jgi:hypothetical protein
VYNLSGFDLDNQDQNLTPTHPKIVKTLLMITNNELGAALVIILLILILTKIIREHLLRRPPKSTCRKDILDRVKRWQKMLEYVYTAFRVTEDEERAFIHEHKRLVNQDITRLSTDDLKILFTRITSALNKYPKEIYQEALSQGELKASLENVKNKKVRHSARVSKSATQKAVPLGNQWK